MDTSHNLSKVFAMALRAGVQRARGARDGHVLVRDEHEAAMEAIETVAGELEEIAATPIAAGQADAIDARRWRCLTAHVLTVEVRLNERRRMTIERPLGTPDLEMRVQLGDVVDQLLVAERSAPDPAGAVR